MNGWGAVFLLVAPDGAALPCHSARMLPDLQVPFVQQQPLREIWYASPAFNRYRGTGWMSATCRSCDNHASDFGGCRCQAWLLTGSAAATDPVCPKSPQRPEVDRLLARAEEAEAERRDARAQPLRFVPGAARHGGLVWRTDAHSRQQCAAGTPPPATAGAGRFPNS
jgi:pyrroloquinoline quinone biosynthesis protein E